MNYALDTVPQGADSADPDDNLVAWCGGVLSRRNDSCAGQ